MLCPWDSSDKNAGSPLPSPGDTPAPGVTSRPLHCRQTANRLAPPGEPDDSGLHQHNIKVAVAAPGVHRGSPEAISLGSGMAGWPNASR